MQNANFLEFNAVRLLVCCTFWREKKISKIHLKNRLFVKPYEISDSQYNDLRHSLTSEGKNDASN